MTPPDNSDLAQRVGIALAWVFSWLMMLLVVAGLVAALTAIVLLLMRFAKVL